MENKERVYLDLHAIQTVPPSCVNRDDTGSPKTAVYGGVRRARVSSQSWKRAMRLMFAEHFKEKELGQRTKKVVDMVAEEIKKMDSSIDNAKAIELAEKVLGACGLGLKKEKGKEIAEASALFFLGRQQANNLAKLILEGTDDSEKELVKKAKEAIVANQAVDIALFGRMVANDPSLNADASAQVAHSISTHRVDNEYDYFTAVDDLAPKDNAGAGMIGVVEYNSATLYRYATVAVHELNRELGNETDVTSKAVIEFIRAFITSMPTGKQNTFANRTLPDAVLITLRKDQPINFAGAFEKPVQDKGNGYVQESVQRLEHYATKVYETFATKPDKAWTIGIEDDLADTEKVSLEQLLQVVATEISAELSGK